MSNRAPLHPLTSPRRTARRVVASVAVVVVAVAVAGCGGGTDGASSSVGDPSVAESTTTAPPTPAELAAEVEARGPWAVGVRTVEVIGARDRVLPVEVWYPVEPDAAAAAEPATYSFPGLEVPTIDAVVGAPPAPGPFPLVVYSHGSGGLRYVSGFLTEHLASHGYVVVAPDHVGNTALDEFTGTDEPQFQVAEDRPADVAAVVTAATSGAVGFEDLSPSVDAERVSVTGHSFGGFTALAAGSANSSGAAFEGLDAIVALAPYSETLPDELLRSVDTPTLLVSGTADITTPVDPNTERPWTLASASPIIRADLRAAGHQSFTDVCTYQELARARTDVAPAIAGAIDTYAEQGCAPDLLPIDRAHQLTRRLVTAFLASQLRGETRFDVLLDPSTGADPDLAVLQARR